jgi:phospholipid transport system transporter-binding protein
VKGARVQRRDDGTFSLSGELSFASVPEVWKAAESLFEGASQFEIDLSEVTRSDSSGLALLVEWARYARREGKEIRFVRVPDQMIAIARVSGLDRVLPL